MRAYRCVCVRGPGTYELWAASAPRERAQRECAPRPCARRACVVRMVVCVSGVRACVRGAREAYVVRVREACVARVRGVHAGVRACVVRVPAWCACVRGRIHAFAAPCVERVVHV
jgi:hypothetical protein